jgi:hypothetical protein
MNIETHHIIAKNPAIKNIVAHFSAYDRLWIVGEMHNGNFATWEIGGDNDSNNGHYDLSQHDAVIDMVERAGIITT